MKNIIKKGDDNINKYNKGDIIKLHKVKDYSSIHMIRNNDRSLHSIINDLKEFIRIEDIYMNVVNANNHTINLSYYTSYDYPNDNYYVIEIPTNHIVASIIDVDTYGAVHINNDFYVYICSNDEYVYLCHFGVYNNGLVNKYINIKMSNDELENILSSDYHTTDFSRLLTNILKVRKEIYDTSIFSISCGDPLCGKLRFINFLISNENELLNHNFRFSLWDDERERIVRYYDKTRLSIKNIFMIK